MHTMKVTRINKECYLTASMELVSPPKLVQLQLHCHFQLHYQPPTRASHYPWPKCNHTSSQNQGINPLQPSVRPWPMQSCVSSSAQQSNFHFPVVQSGGYNFMKLPVQAPFPQNPMMPATIQFNKSKYCYPDTVMDTRKTFFVDPVQKRN